MPARICAHHPRRSKGCQVGGVGGVPVTQGVLGAAHKDLKGAFVAPGSLKAPFRYIPTGTRVIHCGLLRENGAGHLSRPAPVFVAPWCRARLAVQGERSESRGTSDAEGALYSETRHHKMRGTPPLPPRKRRPSASVAPQQVTPQGMRAPRTRPHPTARLRGIRRTRAMVQVRQSRQPPISMVRV